MAPLPHGAQEYATWMASVSVNRAVKAFVRYLLGVDSALSIQAPLLSDGAVVQQRVEIPDLDPLSAWLSVVRVLTRFAPATR